MKAEYEFVVLVFGFVFIFVLSIYISRRVARYLSRFSSFTFLFVGLFGLYYLIDVCLNTKDFLSSPFFYFWISIVLGEMLLFVRALSKK
jgi:hypothetical protein